MSNKRKTAELTVESVCLADLARLPGENPNFMSAHEYQALRDSIASREIGYLQPIVVAEREDGSLVLVDGEHRVKALMESGYTHADAAIAPWKHARMLRVGLHTRGQHDESRLARELKDLVETGYDQDFLSGHSGFDQEALQALLDASGGVELLNLGVDLSRGSSPPESIELVPDRGEEDASTQTRDLPDESTYNLTLRFSTKTDRDRVSQTLRQHGVTPEDGVLILLGLK